MGHADSSTAQSAAIFRMEAEGSMSEMQFQDYYVAEKGEYKPFKQTEPKTARGSYWNFVRAKVRVWCPQHDLQWISDVLGVENLPGAFASLCKLQCGCVRTVIRKVR